MLIAARASMGIGAALIMPLTLASITNTFTDRHERQRAIGFWAATSGARIALGPIVAGLLLAHFALGSVFLINVLIAAAGFGLALALVADSKNPTAQRPDVVGSLLSIAGLGLLLYGIIEAPMHGWTSALVLTTGLGGLAILGAFVGWEWRSERPMLNLRFFTECSFSGAVVSVALTMFGLLGALFLLTQFLQFELTIEPARAADGAAITAISVARQGPEATVLVDAWWRSVPDIFRVVRDAAGVVQGFSSLCQPQELSRSLLRSDPVTAAWMEHLRRDPVPSRQRVLFTRHALATDDAATATLWLDVKRAYLELRPHLRRLYSPFPNLDHALTVLLRWGSPRCRAHLFSSGKTLTGRW